MVFPVMVTSQDGGGVVILQKEAEPHLYPSLVQWAAELFLQ